MLVVLDRRELDVSMLRMARAPAALIYGIVAAAAAACAFAAAARRRAILLGASLVVAPLVLGAWALVLFAYAASVIAIARARIRVIARVAVAGALWVAVPVARRLWLDGVAQADTIALAIVWAGQLYSAFYLIIEREREEPALRQSALADAFYLLALPRLVAPFFQPISPRQLARRERTGMPFRMIWRGAGLAGYAALSAALAWTLDDVSRHIAPWPLAMAVRFCGLYARATYTIFTAVAMFRLLGYNMPSGFRQPFLSRSFAEFFRRYNYYVRGAVLSLFYFPLLGRLRIGRSPRAATILAAYIAILAGSFLLHDLLVPMSLAIEPSSVAGHYLDPVRVTGMLALWTLIIVPTAGIAPRRAPPRSRARTILSIAAFNAVYFVLWYAQHVGRGHR
ncbi:MAG TPA: hypothetical protein VKB80_15655 [Kofleriaceae bacterium]|nr:hypothetical protein [Kofleriaceae bacterium]